MIVFDVDSVRLKSVTEADPKIVNKLYMRYNTERIIKDIPANTFGLVARVGSRTVQDCRNYVDDMMTDYLSG